MMDAIAATAMNMKAAETASGYFVAVAKKVMETQEVAAQELLEMLPPMPPMGEYIPGVKSQTGNLCADL